MRSPRPSSSVVVLPCGRAAPRRPGAGLRRRARRRARSRLQEDLARVSPSVSSDRPAPTHAWATRTASALPAHRRARARTRRPPRPTARVTAAVASSRSAAAPGAPSGAGEQVPEEPLARGAHQHRAAERVQRVEVRPAAASCARRPWRTRGPGRGRPARGRTPAAQRGRRPARRARARTSATTSSYVLEVVHDVGVPAPVHRRRRRRRSGDDRGHRRVGEPAGDVVDDDAHRAATACSATAGARRVDADDGARRAASARPRAAPGRARPRRGTRAGPGPGRLAADVEDVGALGRAARSPCATAPPGSNHSPPSENESGVTLTTPMTRVRSAPQGRGQRRRTRAGRGAGVVGTGMARAVSARG